MKNCCTPDQDIHEARTEQGRVLKIVFVINVWIFTDGPFNWNWGKSSTTIGSGSYWWNHFLHDSYTNCPAYIVLRI